MAAAAIASFPTTTSFGPDKHKAAAAVVFSGGFLPRRLEKAAVAAFSKVSVAQFCLSTSSRRDG